MAKKKYTFPDYASCKEDVVEKRFIQMGASQMAHSQMRKLKPSAFKVYCYMKLESAGKIEFIFPRSKYIGFISAGGFDSAKKQLIELGFIEEIENNKHRKKPNVYRFSSKWKYD